MFGIRKHVLRSSPLALLPLLFLSGATVMLFFCLLGGVTNHDPLNQVFFLQADTSNIPGAPSLAHFTLNNVCGQQNGLNYACRGRQPATPMLPQQLFGTNAGVPEPFLRHPSKFYYLSRFTYAFYIITIFWVILALLLNIAAILSTIATILTALITGIALISCAFLASIMTAVYVQAQDAFRDAGRFAQVGVKAFAFTWTSFTLIALSFLCLLVLYLYRHRYEKHMKQAGEKRKRDSIMDRLLNRRGRRERRSYDSYAKRASYGSAYDDDLRREKEIEHGGLRNYPSRPLPAVGKESGYEAAVPSAPHSSEGGARRFAGNTGGDYTTPGARAGPTSTATPIQSNMPRHPAPVPGVVASKNAGLPAQNL